MSTPVRPGDEPPRGSPWAYLGLGFELVVPIAIGVGVGFWLDRRWGTEPWLVLAGALTGIAAGFLNFFRRVMPPKGGEGPR